MAWGSDSGRLRKCDLNLAVRSKSRRGLPCSDDFELLMSIQQGRFLSVDDLAWLLPLAPTIECHLGTSQEREVQE